MLGGGACVSNVVVAALLIPMQRASQKTLFCLFAHKTDLIALFVVPYLCSAVFLFFAWNLVLEHKKEMNHSTHLDLLE